MIQVKIYPKRKYLTPLMLGLGVKIISSVDDLSYFQMNQYVMPLCMIVFRMCMIYDSNFQLSFLKLLSSFIISLPAT